MLEKTVNLNLGMPINILKLLYSCKRCSTWFWNVFVKFIEKLNFRVVSWNFAVGDKNRFIKSRYFVSVWCWFQNLWRHHIHHISIIRLRTLELRFQNTFSIFLFAISLRWFPNFFRNNVFVFWWNNNWFLLSWYAI